MDGPSKLSDASINRLWFQSASLCPFVQGQRFAIVFKLDCSSSVAAVLLVRGPSAVTRLVGAVIVDAVNGVFWRRRLVHVFKKGREGIAPALADSNPTATVAMEGCVFWILATGDHATPDHIFPRVRLTMRGVSGRNPVSANAPAVGRLAVAKFRPVDGSLRATGTAAPPVGLAACSSNKAKHGPPVEGQT